MFEIQIGDKVSTIAGNASFPMLILGNVGQGKSTTVEKIILELIKNKQKGVFIDPYGDLSKAVKELLLSKETRSNAVFFDDNISEKDFRDNISNKFVLISSDKLNNGSIETRKRLDKIVKMVLNNLLKNSFFIIDEAFELIDKEIFEIYLTLPNKGIYSIFSSEGFMDLSMNDKAKLLSIIKSFVIYKIRNIYSKWLNEFNSIFNPEDISAIKQYSFQFINNGKLTYSKSFWPIEKI